MNDQHTEFKLLLKELGLTPKKLAKILGMTYDSVKSMIAPAKELPKWAVTMLLTKERLDKKK